MLHVRLMLYWSWAALVLTTPLWRFLLCFTNGLDFPDSQGDATSVPPTPFLSPSFLPSSLQNF